MSRYIIARMKVDDDFTILERRQVGRAEVYEPFTRGIATSDDAKRVCDSLNGRGRPLVDVLGPDEDETDPEAPE